VDHRPHGIDLERLAGAPREPVDRRHQTERGRPHELVERLPAPLEAPREIAGGGQVLREQRVLLARALALVLPCRTHDRHLPPVRALPWAYPGEPTPADEAGATRNGRRC
jgi:hypothetical protein